MTEYVQEKKVANMPRIPLEGSIDLTYRCNNNCRHCWLRIPANSPEKENELIFDEIRGIVDEARKMGCRRWSISGGEPMLRPDFADIFDCITSKSVSYSLNTNGTLITPKIARLMKKKGSKMVALYGATAEVHDHITRTSGSFEATMRGFAYLKEANAGFIVQLVPMRDSYHQFDQMVELAKSLSKHYRIGAPWLYLSASGSLEKNREIKAQRLAPAEVIELDKPDLSREDAMAQEGGCGYGRPEDDRLFASCIAVRRDFYVDPYGRMTFCCFIKDPSMLYDLRKGSFEQGWNEFIPSLADKIRGGWEYLDNCASCEDRCECLWCAVYGYLEHGRFSAPVKYLCRVARENRIYKEKWRKEHRRYYSVGGMTLLIEADLPFTETTFGPKLKPFEIREPGDDLISIRHHFKLPDIREEELGRDFHGKAPWTVYQQGDSWIYLGRLNDEFTERPCKVMTSNTDSSRWHMYHPDLAVFRKGRLNSLAILTNDQVVLAAALAHRQGCILHSAALIIDGKGYLFVGQSGAGKSTISLLLKERGEVLCDDRNIVRREANGFRLYGTWRHSDVTDISANSAPLGAIFFLEQSPENHIIPITESRETLKRIMPCLIRPFVNTEWWENILYLVECLVQEVNCFRLQFDKSGRVVDALDELI